MRYLLAVLVLAGITGCQSQQGANVKLETRQDKISYSIGMSVGKNLHRDSIAISPEAFLRGVMDAKLDSSKHLMTEAEIQDTMRAFSREMQVKQEERARAQAIKNITEGATFLAENAKKPGVVTLPSGLQYRVITEGTGKKPQLTSTVKTHYTGRLLDGTEFDSSRKHGQPAEFPCNGVIPGWTEALQLMKAGSKWELYIPSNLAYGEQGAGNVIPPNATLIFEIELLEVQ
jgi:FKBP-type peptidyl-prolyl cis-trans isomerase FklB